MARISTYEVDNKITPGDKVLGTDEAGLVTKNYTFRGIAEWLNNSGLVAINGQHAYFFQTAEDVLGRLPGTISFTEYYGDGVPLSDVTTLKISEQSLAGYTIEDYLETIVGETIILVQFDNTNNFGVYVVTSLERDEDEPSFYNMGLTFSQGNGSLLAEKFYGISVYAGGRPPGDKTYTHVQSVPSETWLIEHNLGKYASVTVVNINNITVYGEVTHIDENNIMVEFSAGFSGKAFIN